MYLAKQEDNIELAIKLYHLIVRGIKQRFGNVLHAYLGEKVALASLYSVNRFAQSVGNIIHRVTLGRQSQNISLVSFKVMPSFFSHLWREVEYSKSYAHHSSA